MAPRGLSDLHGLGVAHFDQSSFNYPSSDVIVKARDRGAGDICYGDAALITVIRLETLHGECSVHGFGGMDL